MLNANINLNKENRSENALVIDHIITHTDHISADPLLINLTVNKAAVRTPTGYFLLPFFGQTVHQDYVKDGFLQPLRRLAYDTSCVEYTNRPLREDGCSGIDHVAEAYVAAYEAYGDSPIFSENSDAELVFSNKAQGKSEKDPIGNFVEEFRDRLARSECVNDISPLEIDVIGFASDTGFTLLNNKEKPTPEQVEVAEDYSNKLNHALAEGRRARILEEFGFYFSMETENEGEILSKDGKFKLSAAGATLTTLPPNAKSNNSNDPTFSAKNFKRIADETNSRDRLSAATHAGFRFTDHNQMKEKRNEFVASFSAPGLEENAVHVLHDAIGVSVVIQVLNADQLGNCSSQ